MNRLLRVHREGQAEVDVAWTGRTWHSHAAFTINYKHIPSLDEIRTEVETDLNLKYRPILSICYGPSSKLFYLRRFI